MPAEVDHAQPSPPTAVAGLVEPRPRRALSPMDRVARLKATEEYRWWSTLDPVARRVIKLSTDMNLPRDERHKATRTPRQAVCWLVALVEEAGRFMDLMQDAEEHSRSCRCSWCRPLRCRVCRHQLARGKEVCGKRDKCLARAAKRDRRRSLRRKRQELREALRANASGGE